MLPGLFRTEEAAQRKAPPCRQPRVSVRARLPLESTNIHGHAQGQSTTAARKALVKSKYAVHLQP